MAPLALDDTAPLLSIPSDPVPADGRAFWYYEADGGRLRAAMFPSLGAPRGTVIISPGRAEPLEKYYEVVSRVRSFGFSAVVHDWRGQGLSARSLPNRMLGHIDGGALYVADHAALLDRLERDGASKPFIALGHSMGGAGVLLCLAEGETRLAGAVLTAPMLGLAGLGARRRLLALLIATVSALGARGKALPIRDAIPRMDRFDTNPLTHDHARYQRFVDLLAAHPDLVLGRPTFGWLDFALRATALLARPKTAVSITLPLLVVNAGQDRVVDPAPAKALAQRLPHGRYMEIAAARHEILAETDELSAPFWAAFEAFLDEVTGSVRRTR